MLAGARATGYSSTFGPTALAISRCASVVSAVVTSGGVSTGDEDHVKPAIEAAGGLTFIIAVALYMFNEWRSRRRARRNRRPA